MVGERSMDDSRTVDEAECMMRVIEQKMKVVKDRIRKIDKGKMVIANKAEDGREHGYYDLKSLCNSKVNAPMIDGGYGMFKGANDDLIWSCSNNRDGGLLDVIQQPCFNVDQRSPRMESVMMGANHNVSEIGDGFIRHCRSDGDGGWRRYSTTMLQRRRVHR